MGVEGDDLTPVVRLRDHEQVVHDIVLKQEEFIRVLNEILGSSNTANPFLGIAAAAQLLKTEAAKKLDPDEKLAEAIQALEFYADKNNWTYYTVYNRQSADKDYFGLLTDDADDLERDVKCKDMEMYHGGKLARETLTKLKK